MLVLGLRKPLRGTAKPRPPSWTLADEELTHSERRGVKNYSSRVRFIAPNGSRQNRKRRKNENSSSRLQSPGEKRMASVSSDLGRVVDSVPS